MFRPQDIIPSDNFKSEYPFGCQKSSCLLVLAATLEICETQHRVRDVTLTSSDPAKGLAAAWVKGASIVKSSTGTNYNPPT